MDGVTTGELAQILKVTSARVSQLVSDGRLEGCYRGDGRARRFDVQAAADALGRKLDRSQLLGNGAKTRQAIAAISQGASPEGGELSPNDPDRYELARTLKAEEEARRLRRQNEESEGLLVLAREVDWRVSKMVGQEVAQFEAMLRMAARRLADRMGVDYREARQVLMEAWREHRGTRSAELSAEAAAAEMNDKERAADF